MSDGRWRTACQLADRAQQLFREQCTGVAWEMSTAQFISLFCLAQLGELDELSRRVTLRLREAEERGDLYSATLLRTGMPHLAWLARDDVEGARAELRIATESWSKRAFYFQHWLGHIAEVRTDLYAGETTGALRRFTSRWPAIRRSLVMWSPPQRLLTQDLRAQTLVAAATVDPARRTTLLGSAERDARRLEAAGLRWADASAKLIRAGVARLRGDDAEARQMLVRAGLLFDDSEMALHASASRWRLGELKGGDEGNALIEDAERWMVAQRIRSPRRMVRMLTPGFGG
jgi:hypothetical protein